MSNASTRSGAGAGGRRLAAAFDSVSELPALAEARRRLLGLCERQAPAEGEIADAIESDAALAIAVMRAANNGIGPSGRTAGVRDALETLRPEGVRALTAGLDTYDVLDHPGTRSDRHERFRRHAVAVRAAAERIGEVARLPQRDELAVAALLHDVGKLVLTELYGDEYMADSRDEAAEERMPSRAARVRDRSRAGRRGADPPLGDRRAGVAAAVERHHALDAGGHAAAIRLADLIVHQAVGDNVPAETLREAAGALDVDDDGLHSLMFEFPHAGERRRRSSEPCPLSAREIDALRGLAEGKVYKQIARELSLSVSTVRTHLHNVYRKIGAVDRAQAVLIARDRGWL